MAGAIEDRLRGESKPKERAAPLRIPPEMYRSHPIAPPLAVEAKGRGNRKPAPTR